MSAINGESQRIRRVKSTLSLFLMIVVATAGGIAVRWRAPGLELYTRDWLMRMRGNLSPPGEVAIVAIDEASIARLGRFPWQRTSMAHLIERLGQARAEVIALDVLYSEPAIAADDRALAEAIARAGNVVVAAQLVEGADERGQSRVAWLRPLPEIERAAAGVGHVHITTGFDGVARALTLRQADDDANALWAIAVETVRVAEGTPEAHELHDAVQIGARRIPLNFEPANHVIEAETSETRMETVRAADLWLDYVGPSGSFAAQTYSLSEVLDGRVSLEKFTGKYVLIGSTAAALGDRVASPFARAKDPDGQERGALMPGVELLANAIHTILRGRFYRPAPDWIAAALAAMVAAAVVMLLAAMQGRAEMIKQLAALTGLGVAILFGSYLAFAHWLVFPPLAPMLTAFAMASPLALLRRSLAVNRNLDARIVELTRAGASLSASEMALLSLQPDPAALIARLTGARAVAIFARKNDRYHLISKRGAAARLVPERRNERNAPVQSITQAMSESDAATRYFSFGDDQPAVWIRDLRAVKIRLGNQECETGVLLLAYATERPPTTDALLISREFAAVDLSIQPGQPWRPGAEDREALRHLRKWWPCGSEWKAHMLGALNRQLIARSQFVERAFRSVDDGLLIAAADGRIVFANPRAASILGLPERLLIGSDLFERLDEAEQAAPPRRRPGRTTEEALMRLIIDRAPIEREIAIGAGPARYYVMRLSTVSDETSGTPLGLVAALSDITRQRELQQTKNDVMALVSHELKTPLTAIQGMSEILAQFDVDPGRLREMHLAINDEAKRLTRMIDEYLDITRLESGARPLRLTSVRLAQSIERTLLMLDPIAARRGMRIVRRLAPNLPATLADADLIARALNNLVANAIKFSPTESEVIVEARADTDAVWITISDQGCGIPAESLPRVFEKFYRVPRVEETDVPGAGLGLAFVREIADLHGGRVTVESEIGVGTVFTLRLPLSRGCEDEKEKGVI